MKTLLNKLLVAKPNKDLGLLSFRILAALALIKAHGLPKLLNIQEAITHIPDPLGLGGTFSTYYAVFANVVCALLVALGVPYKTCCTCYYISYINWFNFYSLVRSSKCSGSSNYILSCIWFYCLYGCG